MTARHVSFKSRLEVFDGKYRQAGDQRAGRDHVCQAAVADFLSDVVSRDEYLSDVIALGAAVYHRSVDHQYAAGFDQRFVFVIRRQVHDDRRRRILDQRRTNLLVGDDHRTVGRAAAHLRPVGGDPGDLLAFVHGSVGQNLTREHDALPAETGDDDFCLHFLYSVLSCHCLHCLPVLAAEHSLSQVQVHLTQAQVCAGTRASRRFEHSEGGEAMTPGN